MRGILGNINFPPHPSIEKTEKIFPNPNEKSAKAGSGNAIA